VKQNFGHNKFKGDRKVASFSVRMADKRGHGLLSTGNRKTGLAV
jgi:hypothetical protein